jgi:1,4-dihydroxy-2-naphthoyl-CoA hydrolase
MNNSSFTYHRTIHFHDTDSAGVVYFANGLAFCHEAYEASLAASGLNLKSFFSGEEIAVPITKASIDFFKPMFCGDRIMISLTTSLLTPASFQIEYAIYFAIDFDVDFDVADREKKAIAKALTKHTCINTSTRKRCDLFPALLKWLELNISHSFVDLS